MGVAILSNCSIDDGLGVDEASSQVKDMSSSASWRVVTTSSSSGAGAGTDEEETPEDNVFLTFLAVTASEMYPAEEN